MTEMLKNIESVNRLENNGEYIEEPKFSRLDFKGGDDIDTMLASIYGTLDKDDINKVMPFKNSYGTILLFKYSKDTPEVYEIMRFIKEDLKRFIPKDNVTETRSFSKSQIQCLQQFMKLMKSEDIMDNTVCTQVYDTIYNTFNLFAEERFTLQEATLFSMCYDVVEDALKKRSEVKSNEEKTVKGTKPIKTEKATKKEKRAWFR